MATSSPRPRHVIAPRKPVTITMLPDYAALAVWRRLCGDLSAPWLDEIGALPVEGDDIDTSLDIWSVALTAALKDPARKETASLVLTRLRKLCDDPITGAGAP